MAEPSGYSTEQIVAEYAQKFETYDAFSTACKNLVERLLEAADLTPRVHSVSCRPKGEDKLKEKCEEASKSGSKYETLTDITDLAGVRVITFFTDDVDQVGALIAKEFCVDAANSID